MFQLNLTPFPVLKTDRLVLRKPEYSDDAELFLLRIDERVNKYLLNYKHDNIEQTRIFIQQILNGIHNNESILWTICLKTDLKRLIGTICLWNIVEEEKTAEIGFVLHPDFHGKGYMREAVEKVIEYGFTTIYLNKMEAYTHIENEASNRLLLSMGFKKGDSKKGEADEIFYSLNNNYI